MKARYLRKLAYIKSEDPYVLNKSDLGKDISSLPSLGYADIVVYLLQTTGTVTLGELQEPPKLQVLHQWVGIVETQWKEYCEERKIEYQALTSSPLCFLIVGKPGCGKTTLAKKLSSAWHCQIVNGTATIQQAMRENTTLGNQARELLQKGEELPALLVASMLEEKLLSLEVQHYGYVLDGVPCLDGSWMSPAQQMAWLFGAEWKPNIIIIIKIPDGDLLKRLTNLKVDPLSGEVYSKSTYEPAKPVRKDSGQDEEADDEEEEEKEEDNLNEAPPPSVLPPAVVERLVTRVQDYPEYAEQRLQDYKKKLLQTIERYMATHPKHYIIELDGNLSPDDMFKALAVKLTAMVVPKALVPKRLIADDEEVDDSESLDNDAFLDRLAHSETLGPQFRWKRSRWGRYCPVQLAKGNMVQGRLEFSVGFLDKMFSLSSADAVMEFTRCPRQFLLPPQPVIPCKICVVGPPSSGKTTLVQMLAKHYSAEIIDVTLLVAPLREKNKQDKIEKLKAEETAKAISLVSTKLKAEQDQVDELAVEVSEDHPEVLALVKSAVENFPQDTPPATNEMLVEAFKLQVEALNEKKVEQGNMQQFGGWVVDGFPLTREQWSVMLEQQVVPEHVLVLSEPDGKEGALLERIKAGTAGDGTEMEEAWSRKYQEFKQHWAHLSAAIKGSAIEPIEVDCTADPETMEHSTVMDLEAVFKHQPVQFSPLEEDADKDDDLSPLDAEETGEEEELQRLTRRPWGVSKHYCPVVLRDQEVLWPGNPDHALRYRDRLYYFSTEEAKQIFEGSPATYATFVQKVPPLRLFLLGPSGAGKTTAGQVLARKNGVFHIAYRQYLHERIAPKLKKLFIGEENYDDDSVPELPKEDEDEEEETEEEGDEFKVPLNEDEMFIYRYLKEDSPLPEEQVITIMEKFWKEEPYKSTGFILEGFPSSEEELRCVAEKGMFADAVAVLEVEGKNVVKRFAPQRLEVWKKKRDEYLRVVQEGKDRRRKQWNDDQEARKAELIEEHDQNKAAREESGEEPDEEEEEEFLMQLKDIENEVYEEEADPQVFEEETVARERVETAIIEKVEEETGSIASLKDTFSELLVPVFSVDANRMKAVVCYSLAKCLSQFTDNRNGLLLKSSFITEEVARALTDHGYKYLSHFGYACPVQSLQDGDLFSGVRPMKRLPVVLGQRVYYLSSEEARSKFLGDPSAYVTQPTPLPYYPLKLAVQGLPKSGKTTVANQMVSEFGLVRVTVGEALRYHLAQFPESHLTEQIKSYLLVGETVPDELCVAALERRMLEAECNTRGMVLDGWPLTMKQVELLKSHHILPAIFVALQVSEEECARRAEKQSSQALSVGPLHDSKMAHTMRVQAYLHHNAEVQQWYEIQHRNWHTVDGHRSRWKVWESTAQLVTPHLKEIQLYIDQIPQGRAASVSSMCLTPDTFATHMGEFDSYCPVSLCLRGELVDCSRDEQFTCVAEYKRKYYRFATKAELHTFLKDPDRFVSPAAQQLLPTKEARPISLSDTEVKSGFPIQMELQGFCPVNYKDGGCRYEALVPGRPEFAVRYKEKIFCFAGEEERDTFMKLPEHYSQVKAPNKLPPLKQSLSLQSLPILGYLEQTAAANITTALTAVGCFKPRLPFQDASSSALSYVAYHLKAHNPNSARHLREKYRRKLQEIESRCLLVKDLASNLCDQYMDPSTQPVVFKSNLTSFLHLRSVLPAGV